MVKTSKFILQLYTCLNDQTNNKGIVWGENKSGFRIINLQIFKGILLEEFGIRNLAAFIRQVNLYGFKMKRNSENQKEYYHPKFIKNEKDKFYQIQRKHVVQRILSQDAVSMDTIQTQNMFLRQQLEEMKSKQDLMLKELKINYEIQHRIQRNITFWGLYFLVDCSKEYDKFYDDILNLFISIIVGMQMESVDSIVKYLIEDFKLTYQIQMSPIPFGFGMKQLNNNQE